jgi:serine/threonine-protein kinase HipA
MIRVWSDGVRAGILDRLEPRGSTFAYDPEALPQRAASLTMPVRVQSWDLKYGLLPIFEMNLPEGALRERLKRQFAKATGSFDDFDLLQIVGRTQLGRLRYSAVGQGLDETVPFQSVDEILRARRDGGLFDYLLRTFASSSGLSGVQPKVLVRGKDQKLSDNKIRQSPSILGATHIVKLWDEDEFPELAANEYFCLKVAQAAGLPVPANQLSDDGGALVIERFDLGGNGYLGFEDFCVLNALGTADKYKGGYETRIFKRVRDYLLPAQSADALHHLFQLFAVNCAVRNGDAHLKNFGILYEDTDAPAAIAPVYDVVTTLAYIPRDQMALTLDGSTNWPDRKALMQLALTRCELRVKEAERIIEATADAISTVSPLLKRYFAKTESEIGERILDAWREGVANSLGAIRNFTTVRLPEEQPKTRIAKSDGLLLELLRRNGGSIGGTLASVAGRLDMAPSTFSASVKRLAERGFIERDGRNIKLLSREV